MIAFNIDSVQKYPKTQICEVRGWASSSLKELVNFNIFDEAGNKIDCTYRRTIRRDIGMESSFFLGFVLDFEYKKNCSYSIEFLAEKESVQEKVSAVSKNESFFDLIKYVNKDTLKRAFRYFKLNGFGALQSRLKQGYSAPSLYNDWFLKNKISVEEIEKQKLVSFQYSPLISIIVPTYNTSVHLLKEMIDSVVNQTYCNWELCIADGSDSLETKEVLKEFEQNDNRIKIIWLKENLGIAGNTNKAFEIATGDYCGLLDHDDFLEPNALFEIVKFLNKYPYDCLYTDEDKYDSSKSCFCDPNFKPDFSIDSLRSHNYITHFFVAKTDLIREVGYEHSEYDGAQDYDLILRCTEKANKVGHVSKVLYHWRMYSGSTAENPAQKMYCYEAGRKALEDHLKRLNISATVEIMPKPYWGLYHVRYIVKEKPLVSIIIPNYENKKVLERCIDSLINVNSYKNIEILIIENNSTSSEIFDYYKNISQKNSFIRVLDYGKHEFNYSAINNYGVSNAKGEYVLLLNNDTEIINPDSIEEMVGICMRKDVGAVGGKLLYPDNTVQHAGVLVGIEGTAAHVFLRKQRDDCGFMMRAVINYNYSAVTGACLMTKKDLYINVGGLDEQLKVAFNDIDYCLKLRECNKLVVYNAFSLWCHYESVSRGYENSLDKIKRFNNEAQIFQDKWKNVLLTEDPYYNPNFIDDAHLFSVKV